MNNETILITGFNIDKPIQAIKAIRAISGFSLKDSKEVIDSLCHMNYSPNFPTRRLNGKTVEITLPPHVDMKTARLALDEGMVEYRVSTTRAAALLAVSLVSQYGPDARAILDEALGLVMDA